ncbi:hypothetical protein [Actinomyces qiguomingii]|uniref:hypothetical protein n=1 Tax=Actinomyces qiguomingii TaxID=2057800 RepID=UPI0011AED472|nr:hypothetical protein [Actinomyces qiguomingii]
MDDCFTGVSSEEIAEIFKRVGMPGGYPRFETVLGVVADMYGVQGLGYVLSDLLAATPNDLHDFFARHVAKGGRHVTANIDKAIERSLESLGFGDASDRILHFHGAAEDVAELAGLGITLANIENGFDESVAAAMSEVMARADVDSVVIMGYSGLDYFDVDPYLRSDRGRAAFKNKSVLWVLHDHTSPELRREDEYRNPAIVAMRSAGADVTVVRGATRRVANRLANKWWRGPVPESSPAGVASAVSSAAIEPFVPTGPYSRESATIELLARLGWCGRMMELLKSNPGLADRRTYLQFADSAWDAGEYHIAERMWRAAYSGQTNDERIQRAERVAACQWIRGRYRQAMSGLLVLADAIDRLPEDEVSLPARLKVADTLVRLLEQMRRLPDVRRYVTSEVRERARDLLPSPVQMRGEALDLRRRVEVSRAKLEADSEEQEELNEKVSMEHASSSSMTRMLTYRQGWLRAAQDRRMSRMLAGERVDDEAWRKEYREVALRLRAIGARGNAARVFMLPRATEVWPLRAPLEMFRMRVRYTFYHRIRMAAHIVVSDLEFRRRLATTKRRGG